MHTKDQTYLAKLGFADRDKKNPLHDAACLYLTQREKLLKLAKLCFPETYADALTKPADEDFEEIRYECGAPRAATGLIKSGYWESEEFAAIKDEAGYYDPKGKSRAEKKIIWEEPDENKDILFKTGISTPLEVRTEGYGYRPASVYIKGYYDLTVRVSFVHRGTSYYKAFMQLNKRVEIPQKYVTSPLVHGYPTDEDLMVEVKAGSVSVNEILQQLQTYSQYDDRKQVVATLFKMDTFSREQLRKHGIHYIYLDPASIEAFREKIGQETEVAEF